MIEWLIRILALVSLLGATWVFYYLVGSAYLWLRPRVDRWIWHLLGGTGDPPDTEET